jgi:hypothetical protein
MFDGRLNRQTGVYRWAGGAVLEDWTRPPSWFTGPFVRSDQYQIPEWLLDFYEYWALGVGFSVYVSEVAELLGDQFNTTSPAAVVFARLVQQQGFQYYPKTCIYGFLPPKRADYMANSKQLLNRADKELSEANELYRNIMDGLLKSKTDKIMNAVRGKQLSDTSTYGPTAEELVDEVMSQGEPGMLFNGDPIIPLSSMSPVELDKIASIRPVRFKKSKDDYQDERMKRGQLGTPFDPADVTSTKQEPLLNPLAEADSVQPPVNAMVKTPKNSNKAAWSSTKLRQLQSNLATYDSEVAQLFMGLTKVLTASMRQQVTQDQLDFDVNFGSPIINNRRQLSVTVRKPIECRVVIIQTLRSDGNTVWEAEVWDMRGIPSPDKYKAKYNQAIGVDSARQPLPPISIGQPDPAPSPTPEPPGPPDHKKRPRQIRI